MKWSVFGKYANIQTGKELTDGLADGKQKAHDRHGSEEGDHGDHQVRHDVVAGEKDTDAIAREKITIFILYDFVFDLKLNHEKIVINERHAFHVIEHKVDERRAKLSGDPGDDGMPRVVLKGRLATVLNTGRAVVRCPTFHARVGAVWSDGEWQAHVLWENHGKTRVEILHGTDWDQRHAERRVPVADPHEHHSKERHGQGSDESELKHGA